MVEAELRAIGSDQLWVRPDVRADVRRIAYVCFNIDAFSRMSVGWRVVSHTETVLYAIGMARRGRLPALSLGWAGPRG